MKGEFVYLFIVDREGKNLAPAFVMVDPFGFSGTPMSVIHRILKQPRAEVLVTFVVDSVNRHVGSTEPKINAHYDDLFGTDEWRALAHKTGRFEDIRDLYREQLLKEADYVRGFRMRTLR